MGADIHIVIEIDPAGTGFLHPEGLAYLEWPRCTKLFVALGAFNRDSQVPARGFPSSCSLLACEHYALRVCPDGELIEYASEFMPVIEETAAQTLVQEGRSHFVDHCSGLSISHPDYEFPNWITLDELESVRDSCHANGITISPECDATVLLMREMKSRNIPVRLVYWFDV